MSSSFHNVQFTLNYANEEKTVEILMMFYPIESKQFLKYFPLEVNITHWSVHFMCLLPYPVY